MQKIGGSTARLENRLEAEGTAGVQAFMEITEGKHVEVQVDEKHLMELILSPSNMNRVYRRVVSNGGREVSTRWNARNCYHT